EGLKDKILREVFGPPPVQYYRRHPSSHSTVPRLKPSQGPRRRSNLSVNTYPRRDSKGGSSLQEDQGSPAFKIETSLIAPLSETPSKNPDRAGMYSSWV